MDAEEITERLIKIRSQQERFASEIEDQKKTERDAHSKITKRLDDIEEFLYRGNGQEPATVRLSQVEGLVEVAEKFIMRHEGDHKTVDASIKEITTTIATAKGWIAGAILVSTLFGTIAGFLLNLYFTGKP